MNVLHLPPVPDSFYDKLGYPKEGKCSDLVVLTEQEADALYEAAEECYRMMDEAAAYIIDKRLYDKLGIPDYAVPAIEMSFNDEGFHRHMLCRFDFAGGVDGVPIKMIECNADTPFSVFEVSTVQYALAKFHGLEPEKRQYNLLFESLQELFAEMHEESPNRSWLFTNAADGEDDLNTLLLKEAADRATGKNNDYLHWTDVCIDATHGFVQVDEQGCIKKVYDTVVKMVPWDLLFLEQETMAREMCKALRVGGRLVLNPPYAALYQNKGIMAVMHELFPDSPYLLESRFEPLQGSAPSVQKPLWGREGQNITLLDGSNTATPGFYGNVPMLYQAKAQLNRTAQHYYQAGVFCCQGYPCGIGFRRSVSPIITTDDELCGHILDAIPAAYFVCRTEVIG